MLNRAFDHPAVLRWPVMRLFYCGRAVRWIASRRSVDRAFEHGLEKLKSFSDESPLEFIDFERFFIGDMNDVAEEHSEVFFVKAGDACSS
jgi:hypothetical protein